MTNAMGAAAVVVGDRQRRRRRSCEHRSDRIRQRQRDRLGAFDDRVVGDRDRERPCAALPVGPGKHPVAAAVVAATGRAVGRVVLHARRTVGRRVLRTTEIVTVGAEPSTSEPL